jgi:hypothetical protein
LNRKLESSVAKYSLDKTGIWTWFDIWEANLTKLGQNYKFVCFPHLIDHCDWKYFLGDLARGLFFWLPEVPILFQNLCFELVYTVLYDQNLLLDLGRNQICVIGTQHWSFVAVNVMLSGILDKHQCGSNFFLDQL